MKPHVTALILACAITACVDERLPAAETPAVQTATGEPAKGLAEEEAEVTELSSWQRERLRKLGYRNPEEELVAELIERPDLLPPIGQVGGTPYFVPGQTHLLTDRWVLATFEDGHVRGRALFAFEPTETGLDWRLVSWYLE